VERIDQSELREVVVTDSIPIAPEKRGGKLKVISLAPLIAEAIIRIHRGQSVGALFTSEVKFTQEMLLWDVDSGGERPSLGANSRSVRTEDSEEAGGDPAAEAK